MAYCRMRAAKGADPSVMGRLLFTARTIVAVVVASVVLGFVVAPGPARPSDNPIVTVGRVVVEGMAAFGREVVDRAASAVPQHPGR